MKRRDLPDGLAILASMIFAATVGALLYFRFANFDPSCLDYTGFTYFRTRIFPKLFHGGILDPELLMMILFTPMTTLVEAIFAVVNTYLFLIGAHVIFTGCTIWAVYRLAETEVSSRWWALLLALSFALNPIFDIYSTLGYKPEILGNLLVILALYGYRIGNRKLYTAALIGALASKVEYIPVALLLAVWFRFFERDSTYAKRTALIAGSYTLALIIFVIVGAVAGPGLPKHDYQSSSDLFTLVFKMPFWSFVKQAALSFTDAKSLKIFLPVLPVLFLPFLSPVELFLPALAQLVGSVGMSGFFLQMSVWQDVIDQSPKMPAFFLDGPRPMVVLLPFIYFAAARGLNRFLKRIPGRAARVLIAAGVAGASLFSYYFFIPPATGPWPLTASWDPARFRPSAHTELLRSELSQMRNEKESVALSMPLEIYLKRKNRDNVSNIPVPVDSRFDRVLIDLYLCPGFPAREDVLKWVEMILQDRYAVRKFQDGIVVLTWGQSDEKNIEVLDFINRNRPVLKKCFFDFREYRRRIEGS